jgi:sugar lactone lactonase YvrE
MTALDVVVNLRSKLGEGPVWDHRARALAWVDILAGLVHLTDPGTGSTEVISVGAPVGALALLGDSDYLLAVRNGFAALSGTEVGAIEEVFNGEGMRMNDGSVDPTGRFVAGSMGDGESPVGSLYSRESGGAVRTLIQDVTISNGIAWSSDGAVMYYVDSALQAIDVMDYDVETGMVSDRRRWVEIDEREGTPDGITIDTEGCVWVALWDGGRVRRYSPAGAAIQEIELPVRRVTSCAFGGPELDRLFISTASVGIDPSEPGHELAGAMFVADPGCRGFESTIVER